MGKGKIEFFSIFSALGFGRFRIVPSCTPIRSSRPYREG